MEHGSSPAVGRGNPFLDAPSAKKTLTLVGIYVAVLGSIIQSNTMSTLLPVAGAEIGGLDYYSLASTSSSIVGIVFMPLWGYLCARSPHIKRHLFTASLLIGAATILVRAFAPNMMAIVASSSLYGLVSCGIFVVGFSIIRDMYDARKAGTYLGITGTIMMVGALVGPVAGGAIMTYAGWRALCHCIWPLMLVGALMVWFGVSATKDECAGLAVGGGKFDAVGTVAMALFVGALVVGLSTGTSFLPFGTLGSNLVFLVAGVFLIVFAAVVMRKGDDAIIPLGALKDCNTIMFSVANFFSNISHMAIFFFLPLYVLNIMGLTPTESGIIMACYSIAGLFLSPVYGRVIGKSGSARGALALASVMRIVVAAGFILLLTPETPIYVICALMLVGGVYNCAGGSIFSAGPQVQLRAEIRAQGNAIIQQMQTLGSSLGIAIYTACIGLGGMEGGMQIALVVSIACAAVALVAALGLKKADVEAGR